MFKVTITIALFIFIGFCFHSQGFLSNFPVTSNYFLVSYFLLIVINSFMSFIYLYYHI